MRDSTIFYRSFYEALRELPPVNQGEIYNAIFEYCFNDQTIELNGLSKTIFTLIKPQLDANNKRFENGKKGGRPNQNETKDKPNNNQNETKTEANNNNNVNNNVNKNNNGNENGEKKPTPPARDQFLSFCQTLDIDFESLKETIGAKYDTWLKAGWKDGNGKPIDDYEQKIINTLPYLKPMPKKNTNTTTKVKSGIFGKKEVKHE